MFEGPWCHFFKAFSPLAACSLLCLYEDVSMIRGATFSFMCFYRKKQTGLYISNSVNTDAAREQTFFSPYFKLSFSLPMFTNECAKSLADHTEVPALPPSIPFQPVPCAQNRDNRLPEPWWDTFPKLCTSWQPPFCWHHKENGEANLQQAHAKCNLHRSAGCVNFHCAGDLPDQIIQSRPTKKKKK